MRILVSPLDWGLGHATRSVPIIRRLLKKGHEVDIAGSGRSIALLQQEFPDLQCFELKSFSPKFFHGNAQWLAIALQVPKFLIAIFSEKRATQTLVNQRGYDAIISDNRYGVRDRRCRSILVTHQLSPRIAKHCPAFLERILAYAICGLANKFDYCLVPDIQLFPTGLVGELSRPRRLKIPIHAIGILSRLNCNEAKQITSINWLSILSGPEPQRTIFENLILEQFKRLSGKRVIVRGVAEKMEHTEIDGIELLSHCDAPTLSTLIQNSRVIVCRSGYSTIMDLVSMKKTALLVPTPGQAEQEYLAVRMQEFGFKTCEQNLLCVSDLSALL